MINRWKKDKKQFNSSDSLLAGSAKPQRVTNRLDQKLMGESRPEKLSSKTAKFIRTHRNIALAVCLFMFLTLLLSVVLSRRSSKTSEVPSPKNCREALSEKDWGKVVDGMKDQKPAKLQKTIQIIENKCSIYSSDNDYLYVSTVYYIGISDYKSARESNEKIKIERNNNNFKLLNYFTLESYSQLNQKIVAIEKAVKNNNETKVIIPSEGT